MRLANIICFSINGQCSTNIIIYCEVFAYQVYIDIHYNKSKNTFGNFK